MVVVALVARQRSHLKAIVTLADVGLSLEAEIIDRTMFEFFVRLKWLLIDAELHRILWMLDDIGYRFTIDAEIELIPQLRIEGLGEIGEELQELAVMRLEQNRVAPQTDEPPRPAAEDTA